jgi:hypothetical protein
MSEEDQALEALLASYRRRAEDGDPNRTEYGFMVVITCPNRMDRETVERDLLNSIEFGQPSLTLLYDVPAPRPIEVATPKGSRL